MNWTAAAAFVAVVLVSVPIAQSPQLSNGAGGQDLKGRPVTIRACVEPGSHGAITLSQVVQTSETAVSLEHGPVVYWFNKNIDRFQSHLEAQVEISGTIQEVKENVLALKASDGVFAEVQRPATEVTASKEAGQGALGTAGSVAPDKAVGTAGAVSSESLYLSRTVVKVELDKIKVVGTCR